jgi:hypothetical protein
MLVTILLSFQLDGDAVLLALGLLAAGFVARQLAGRWFTPADESAT